MTSRRRFAALCCTVLTALLAPCAHAAGNDRARNVAASCTSCHGTDGASKAGMPPLAGQGKADLMRKMQDFKSGRTPSTIMGQIAKGYSDEQIDLAAAFFSRQKP